MQPDPKESTPPVEDGGLIGEARRELELLDNFADRRSVPVDDAARGLPEPIGPYRPIRVLGKGGMGIVYLAEQTQPIRRTVALKLIKAGMDTEQVIRRFEAERQALALMNHANVAKVFDAGATATGRPYFVMEYVEGVPITDYCDRNHLTIEERLKLFVKVCEGVQHAHQKGIIHRDLKPSNVLVELRDGQPAPKVIDFGLAKTFEQPLTDQSLHTHHDHTPGTPGYMSPEQARGGGVDIDTRTDVYSLGVLAYELLVGVLPHDAKKLWQADAQERLRIISEVDPPTPSTRITSPADDTSAVAERRNTSRNALIHILRNDLDWIVMKCLEKDRARRYSTANALAMDVQRYLNREPVVARPPSAMYRLKKLVRRNLATVAAIGLVLLGTTGGMVGAMRERATAERERLRAEEGEALALIANADAQKAREIADQVTQFLTGMLSAADPAHQGKDIRVREVLDRAAEGISQQFHDKPLVEARIRTALGLTYNSLGHYELAEAQLTDAASTYHRLLGAEHPETLAATTRLAETVGDRGGYSTSEATHRATLEIQRRVLGEEHPDTLTSMTNVANMLYRLGRYQESIDLHRRTLEIRRHVLGEEDTNTVTSIVSLGNVMKDAGQAIEAEGLYRRALEIRSRNNGEEHPLTLNVMNNLAIALELLSRYPEAEELNRRTLDIRSRVLGEAHPQTLGSMNNLANLLSDQGRLSEAEELYRSALAVHSRTQGEEHPDTLMLMNNVGNVLRRQRRYADAETFYRKTLDIRRRVLGERHPDTLATMENLGTFLADQGRYLDAEAVYRETLGIERQVLGEEHPDTLTTMGNLASVLLELKRYAEAEQLARGASVAWEKQGGAARVERLRTVIAHGESLTLLGRFAEAEPTLIGAYDAMLNRPDVGEADRRRALYLIVRLYESWSDADPNHVQINEVAEWRAKLEEFSAANTLQPVTTP